MAPWNRRGRTDGKPRRPALQIYRPPGATSSNRAHGLQQWKQMASNDENEANQRGRLIETPRTKCDKEQTCSRSRGDTEDSRMWQASRKPDQNTAQPKAGGSFHPQDSNRQLAKDVVCAPRHEITRKAINDPDSLHPDELTELVRAICKAAAGRIDSAEAAANFCILVAQKEREPRFINCLVGRCQEWYKRRDDWIPRRLWNEGGDKRDRGTAPRYQWKAFVAFLAELLVALTGGGRSRTGAVAVSPDHVPARLVSELLCDCCQIMARWPAKDVDDEMECFVFVIKRAGNAIKLATPHRLDELVGDVHEAQGQFPDAVQPVSRELRQLRRS